MPIPPATSTGGFTVTHREVFDAFEALGPLRIISIAGPSVFESIGRLQRWGFADGHMNAFTDAYHWHLELARFRHVRSRDEVHERSGRRVLYFELREEAEAAPFLRVYLHREKDEAFDAAREHAFGVLHARLDAGASLSSEVAP
jgi:hypothetical protein